MKRALQLLSLFIAVIGITLWLAKGANLGWSKTKVQVKTIDAVTEIEIIEWQKKFVPGLDFLGITLLGAVAIASAALFLSRKTQTKN